MGYMPAVAAGLMHLPWVEHRFPGGWYAKVTTFSKYARANQHKHEHDHLTVVNGPFRIWIGTAEGVSDACPYVDIGGDYQDHSIVVAGGLWHMGQALAHNVSVMCLHQGTPNILEEAQPLLRT